MLDDTYIAFRNEVLSLIASGYINSQDLMGHDNTYRVLMVFGDDPNVYLLTAIADRDGYYHQFVML
jgi:hypothetical protein